MDRREEIRRRHEATTPGPWTVNSGGFHAGRQVGAPFGDSGQQSIALCRGISIDGEGGGEKDAEFIAMAWEDIPYLLQRVDRLEAQNLRLRRKINQIDDAVEAIHYEMEDGSLPLSAKRRLEDILSGTYSRHLE